MSFGIAAMLVAAVLSARSQTEDVEWEIDGGTGSSLRGWFLVDPFPVGLNCEGTPPVFEIVFFSPKEVRQGEPRAIRIPPGPVRPGGWQEQFAALNPDELEFLAKSAGVVEVEIHSPDGEVNWYRSPQSGTFAAALAKFLEYCAHHVQKTDRQFQLDGIQVELQIEVDEKGIEDIRALAEEFGVRDVQKIFIGSWGIPVSSPAAVVESRQVRDGDRMAHRMLVLRQKYWEVWNSSEVESEDDFLTRGLWRARRRDFHVLDRWTIRDGDWSIEVRLGEGVPYDDAVRVIHAFRTGTLVDVREGPPGMHLAAPTEPYEFKDWSAEHPLHIRRDETASESRRYEISIPSSGASGRALQVRIVGDRVEVLGVSVWIV